VHLTKSTEHGVLGSKGFSEKMEVWVRKNQLRRKAIGQIREFFGPGRMGEG